MNFTGECLVEYSDIKKMCSTLVHRGPDDEGIYIEKNVGIGVRRLSIIDIEGGRQPIANEDNTIKVICNGEIYNFLTHRKQLIQKGHTFRTGTDTEVIVHLYEDYGIDCVHLLRGMFAFAIWDSRSGSLFLSRDRLGQKPLYYYEDEKRFIFASEIKAILTCSGINTEIDYKGINDYLHFGFIPSPKSAYKCIKKVAPAHWLKIENGNNITKQRYWEIPWPNPVNHSEIDFIKELDFRLKESVRLRLNSDVPLGAFLSGGVDSSVIVGVMSQVSKNPIKTINMGFSEKSFDETGKAKKISELFHTDHYTRILHNDINDLIFKVIAQFDEPFADDSALPTYLLSKYTREHVTVVLSGDGGDELFGGYMRYKARKFMKLYFLLPSPVRKTVERLVAKMPEKSDYFMKSVVKQTKHFINYAKSIEQKNDFLIPYIFNKDGYYDLFTPYFTDYFPKKGSYEEFSIDTFMRKYRLLDELTRMMYMDINTYLSDDILMKVDHMSMVHSLEVRCPFLDHPLVEFATTIPINFKIRGIQTKYLLKRYAEQRITKDIIRRKKHGFNFPLGELFKTTLKPILIDLLLCKDNSNFLDSSTVKNLLQEHWSNRIDHSKKIWTILVLVIWNQQKKIL